MILLLYFYTCIHCLKPVSVRTAIYLVVALGDDEEIVDAIEEELILADEDINIISETAADSGRRQVRRLHLERQRSTQFDSDPLSPQHSQPLSPQRSQPTTPVTPRERKMDLVRQISKQKSLNVPPEKMDKGAAKDEQSRLIQAEAAETGNVCKAMPFQQTPLQAHVRASRVVGTYIGMMMHEGPSTCLRELATAFQ